MPGDQEKTLEVELFWSPVADKEKFEGEAKAVTSENEVGEFDILPEHANFITLIFNSLTVYTPEEEKEYEFSRGVVEVADNKVRIFLEV
ncbi:MAG: hypothetical protein V5A57_01160 [Candidatus Paceibacterota bacterium]